MSPLPIVVTRVYIVYEGDFSFLYNLLHGVRNTILQVPRQLT